MGSLTVREAEQEDRAAIRRIVADAFEREDEAKIVEALWTADAMAIELVAVHDGEVVGHIAFSPVTAEPALKGGALGLAPVSVAPAHQNKGVGAALVETGLDIARTRGASLVVVLGEPSYYGRFGFTPGKPKGFTWAVTDAGDAFQILDYAGIPAEPARRIHYHSALGAA